MLTRWLSNLESVRWATTREEREAIYRFRYRIYYEELGRLLGNPDHEKRWVTDEDDERDCSLHLYTGTPEKITGVLRIRRWAPGTVPEAVFKMFNMSVFPGIETLRIGELGRLMIDPTQRGSLLLLSIARNGYERLASEATDLAFCFGAPGLVRHYRRLGFCLFPCPLIPTPDGMNVGLVSVLSDDLHHRRMGSPVTGLARRYYSRAKREEDRKRYRPLLQDETIPLEFDPERIWAGVESELLSQSEDTPSFLEHLPARTVKLLTSQGFVIDISADTLVTRAGHGEREMYVILEGACEVVDKAGRRVWLLSKGDVFGEVAFFRESGRRSATVRAVERSKVLVLPRRFLKTLMRKDPSAASQILFNLGRILAERLATMIQERQLQEMVEEEVE